MNFVPKERQLSRRKETLLAMCMPMATSPGIPVSIDWDESTSSGNAISMFDPYVGNRGNEILESYEQLCDLVLSEIPDSGSGGGATANRTRFEFESVHAPEYDVEGPKLSCIADELVDVQQALSLNVKELAAVLHVQRPTVYSWLRGERSNVRGSNRRRINEIAKVARAWTRMSDFPFGAAVRSELDESGRSLVDLLAESPIDEGATQRHLEACRRKQLAAEAAEPPWPPSMQEIARKHGIEPEKLRQSDHIIDTITGRPIYRD